MWYRVESWRKWSVIQGGKFRSVVQGELGVWCRVESWRRWSVIQGVKFRSVVQGGELGGGTWYKGES